MTFPQAMRDLVDNPMMALAWPRAMKGNINDLASLVAGYMDQNTEEIVSRIFFMFGDKEAVRAYDAFFNLSYNIRVYFMNDWRNN